MTTYSVSTTFNSKWCLDFATNYHFDEKGNCLNVKTGRIIKKVLKSYSKGFNINGKFYTCSTLRKRLIVIEVEETPF